MKIIVAMESSDGFQEAEILCDGIKEHVDGVLSHIIESHEIPVKIYVPYER